MFKKLYAALRLVTPEALEMVATTVYRWGVAIIAIGAAVIFLPSEHLPDSGGEIFMVYGMLVWALGTKLYDRAIASRRKGGNDDG